MKISRKKRSQLVLKYLKKKEKTINLGSGTGEMAKFFKKNVKNLVNVDISYGNKQFNLNNKFPIKSSSYGNIIATEVIEHLDNPNFFIGECCRILKRSGKLIITTPNMTGIPYHLSEDIGSDKFPHICAFNLKMLEYLLSKHKFKIINKFYTDFFWNKNYFFKFLAHIFPKLRSNIFIVAEK